jgi:hypothetical protein
MGASGTLTHRLQYVALWSLTVQIALLASSLFLYSALGLSVAWDSALAIVFVAAGLTLGWAYFAATKSSATEQRIGNASLAIALLLLLSAIMTPAQYAAAALNRPLIDPALAQADGWLGVDVSEFAMWTRAHPWISDSLNWGYFTLLWQLALIVPVLAMVRDDDALAEYIFHFHSCSIVTIVTFALFPAASAFQYLGFQSTLPEARFMEHFNGVRAGQMTQLVFGQMEGLVSMPSFHVAGALMVTWATRRHLWLFVPLIAVNTVLCAATFLSGAHYLVDTVAAFGLVALSVWAWRRLEAHTGVWPQPVTTSVQPFRHSTNAPVEAGPEHSLANSAEAKARERA